MRFIDLKEAVSHTHNARTDPESDKRLPFFFMIGAGISYPQVPLASGIISHCKEKVGPDETLQENKLPLEDYSFWLDKAYPQPVQRQKY